MEADIGRNDTFGKIASALAKAQAAFPKIKLDREVTVKTLTGGSYKFKYATLGNIIEATRPALTKNDLAVSQSLNGTHVSTRLLHGSGEVLTSDVEIPTTKRDREDKEVPLTIQERGSAYSYYRRYAYAAIVGVVGEEDDDANVADGNSFQDSQPRGPVAPTPIVDKGVKDGRITPVAAQTPPPATKPAPATAKKAPAAKTAPKPAPAVATPPAKPSEAPAPAPDTPPPAEAPQVASEGVYCFGEPQAGEPLLTQSLKAKIIAAFKQYGITQADLEKKAGFPMDKWTGSEQDRTLGMRANLNTDFQCLVQKWPNKDGVACTADLWLKSECPALDFPDPSQPKE